MGFSDLFIKNGDAPKEVAPQKPSMPSSTTKFPTPTEQSTPLFNASQTPAFTSTPVSGGMSQEHLNNAIEVYQRGFDSLNQPGYDFYEFYQAVVAAGIDNPQIYQMAFMMGNGMDKSITKDKLLQQSDFYLNEITKVHSEYVTKGSAKRQELEQAKTNENQSLLTELEMMKQQLEAIKVQIADRENKLQAIGGKYEPKINEVNSKLAANETAKNTIVNSINQVKNGIISNLK